MRNIIVSKPHCAFCKKKLKKHIDEVSAGLIKYGKIFCSIECLLKYEEEEWKE